MNERIFVALKFLKLKIYNKEFHPPFLHSYIPTFLNSLSVCVALLEVQQVRN